MNNNQMTFWDKICDIQLKLKAPKSQYNDFGKYNYRNCEDILEAVKPLLNEHKLVLSLSDSIEAIQGRFYVKATVIVTDGENVHKVEAYAREEESKKGMDGSQVTGASSSYAFLDFDWNGKHYTAGQAYEMSRKKNGKPLCKSCADKQRSEQINIDEL